MSTLTSGYVAVTLPVGSVLYLSGAGTRQVTPPARLGLPTDLRPLTMARQHVGPFSYDVMVGITATQPVTYDVISPTDVVLTDASGKFAGKLSDALAGAGTTIDPVTEAIQFGAGIGKRGQGKDRVIDAGYFGNSITSNGGQDSTAALITARIAQAADWAIGNRWALALPEGKVKYQGDTGTWKGSLIGRGGAPGTSLLVNDTPNGDTGGMRWNTASDFVIDGITVDDPNRPHGFINGGGDNPDPSDFNDDSQTRFAFAECSRFRLTNNHCLGSRGGFARIRGCTDFRALFNNIDRCGKDSILVAGTAPSVPFGLVGKTGSFGVIGWNRIGHGMDDGISVWSFADVPAGRIHHIWVLNNHFYAWRAGRALAYCGDHIYLDGNTGDNNAIPGEPTQSASGLVYGMEAAGHVLRDAVFPMNGGTTMINRRSVFDMGNRKVGSKAAYDITVTPGAGAGANGDDGVVKDHQFIDCVATNVNGTGFRTTGVASRIVRPKFIGPNALLENITGDAVVDDASTDIEVNTQTKNIGQKLLFHANAVLGYAKYKFISDEMSTGAGTFSMLQFGAASGPFLTTNIDYEIKSLSQTAPIAYPAEMLASVLGGLGIFRKQLVDGPLGASLTALTVFGGGAPGTLLSSVASGNADTPLTAFQPMIRPEGAKTDVPLTTTLTNATSTGVGTKTYNITHTTLAGAGNVGTSTFGAITATAPSGQYLLTVLTTSNTSPFTVTGPNGYAAKGVVGTAFSQGGLAFTLTAGGTVTAGDQYSITVGNYFLPTDVGNQLLGVAGFNARISAYASPTQVSALVQAVSATKDSGFTVPFVGNDVSIRRKTRRLGYAQITLASNTVGSTTATGAAAIFDKSDEGKVVLGLTTGAFTIVTVTSATVATVQVTQVFAAAVIPGNSYYIDMVGRVDGALPTELNQRRGALWRNATSVGRGFGPDHPMANKGFADAVQTWYLQFNTGSVAYAVGSTVTQGGVSAKVLGVYLSGGTWGGGNAAGTLALGTPTGGNFAAGALAGGGVATATNVQLSHGSCVLEPGEVLQFAGVQANVQQVQIVTAKSAD